MLWISIIITPPLFWDSFFYPPNTFAACREKFINQKDAFLRPFPRLFYVIYLSFSLPFHFSFLSFSPAVIPLPDHSILHNIYPWRDMAQHLTSFLHLILERQSEMMASSGELEPEDPGVEGSRPGTFTHSQLSVILWYYCPVRKTMTNSL